MTTTIFTSLFVSVVASAPEVHHHTHHITPQHPTTANAAPALVGVSPELFEQLQKTLSEGFTKLEQQKTAEAAQNTSLAEQVKTLTEKLEAEMKNARDLQIKVHILVFSPRPFSLLPSQDAFRPAQ